MAGDSHELAETLRIHGPRVCRARLTRPLSHANETLVARRPPEVVSLGSSSALWAGSVAGCARDVSPLKVGISRAPAPAWRSSPAQFSSRARPGRLAHPEREP